MIFDEVTFDVFFTGESRHARFSAFLRRAIERRLVGKKNECFPRVPGEDILNFL